MKHVIYLKIILLTIGLSMDVHSGGELSKNQMAIDINHYDIRLKVDTKRKMISGYVDIKMKIVDDLRFIELDLIMEEWIGQF